MVAEVLFLLPLKCFIFFALLNKFMMMVFIALTSVEVPGVHLPSLSADPSTSVGIPLCILLAVTGPRC